jgi:hypothetical protein
VRKQPASSTARFKSADDRLKAEEDLRRRIDEVKMRTSTFLQDCIDEEKANEKKHATATAQGAKEPDKEMQNTSEDSFDIFAMGKKNAGSYDWDLGRIDRYRCKFPGCRCLLCEPRELTAEEEEWILQHDPMYIHDHDADA